MSGTANASITRIPRPTGAVTINGGASATSGTTASLTLLATDTYGVSQMKFSNDNSTWSSAESYATTRTWTLATGDGAKTVYVKYQDNAGNWSGAYSDTITLDSVAPAGSLNVNSGASYTGTTTVTLNLSATDSVGVAGYYVSETSTTPSAGASGWVMVTSVTGYSANVSYALSGGDGAKMVYAWYKDTADSISSPASKSIVLDATSPTVASTYPASNGTGLALNGVITATFSEVMDTATVGTSTFTFSGGTGTVSYSGTTASFTPALSLDYATLYTGTVTTGVKDLAGNAMESTAYYCRIAAQNGAGTSYGSETTFTTTDGTAPAGTLVINTGASYTTSAGVTLNLSATDARGVTGYYVSSSSSAPLAGDAGWTTVTSTTTYTANVSYSLNGSDGSKTVYVWYKDAAGNVSSVASDSITLDTIAPTVSLNAVTSPTKVASQMITGVVEAGATVSIVTNTAASDGAATVSGTSWSYTITGLVEGANGITVTATDAAGNTAMATGSITLDTVAPPVSMNAVASPTRVTSQTITGTVGEDSTVSVATNTAASDGAAVVTGTTWSYTITGLVEGANGITVTATDTAGNTATASGSIILDTTAPTVSLNGVTSPTNATSQTITGTVEAGATVSVTTDTAASDGAATVSGTTWSYTITGLVAGANGITVTATDTAGNTATATGSVTLDSGSPVVAITSPTSNAAYTTTSNTINLGGTAVDGGSGLAGVAWSDSQGNNGTASGTSSWSISGIPLSLGENTITVTATDVAGNTGADTIVVAYATAPAVSTGIAASVTLRSAILNGRASANEAETTVWFEYGVSSGVYGTTTPSLTMSGTTTTGISGSIRGLEEMTTYYCRIAARNSAGTTYGSERRSSHARRLQPGTRTAWR